ncbi:hypothetical protein FOL47_010733 [Perkinsus chesapeaki]|uniref:Uncharacterized protein n=1 Tax=Perkinsus chesapeaki TaxID=330153 RepID=A0A7J6MNZ4_PERCH|nr:hypothetical protein FOL47_010733 [Perkinsus chesapeaki]
MVKSIWPFYSANDSTAATQTHGKVHYTACGKNNLAETCPFMRQGGVANYEKHMLTQIEPRIDAVLHKVTFDARKLYPVTQKFHVKDDGPHFGHVHLPKSYQEALDRLDSTRRPAMLTNPGGIPLYEIRPGPDDSSCTSAHHHLNSDTTAQDPDAAEFPNTYTDVWKRRDNWEEVRISALHNGRMGLFDVRHPPKNPEVVDSEALSESHPLYDRNRVPPELQRPVHDYEGFHDHIKFLHPAIEFRHWVHYAKVKLVNLNTGEVIWDKLYEELLNSFRWVATARIVLMAHHVLEHVHGHKIASDQRDVGGPIEFRGLDTRLGRLDMFRLTVDADNPNFAPHFDSKPASNLRKESLFLLLTANNLMKVLPADNRSFRGQATTSAMVNRSSTAQRNVIECPKMGTINMSYYRNGDSFHRAIADGVFKPMKVYEEAKQVCDGPRLDKMSPSQNSKEHWAHCLPIRPNRNTSECAGVTRSSLLDPRVPKPVCGSAMLDLLAHDVYRTMEEVGCNPMLTLGTALGALRNGSHVPWTEDADLAYLKSKNETSSCVENPEFSKLLRSRGYFTFKHDIWRVCMSSDHPLAGHVYDIDARGKKAKVYICQQYGCVYVDLYAVSESSSNSSTTYSHQAHPQAGFVMESDKVIPSTTVSLNGISFSTFNDVDWFLSTTYGKDYMKPKSREDWKKDMKNR